ncbi:molecular mechanism For the regulation of protein kinase B Akt By hydrophobic motif phosphorylation, partial [Rozella allomycis CSF55]
EQYYAVKIIKKTGLIDEESLDHVLSENRVLQAIDYPFLVKLYSSFQTTDRLYFVMEYVKGGELFFHLGKERKFKEDRVQFYASQVVLALTYLHSKGVVYRDLKLENLLLDEQGYIKITDFGLCKQGIASEIDRTSTFCGTPEYLAPEILEEEVYGRSVDWWALGVVIYEMMIGRPPFGPATNMEQLFNNILHQKILVPLSLSTPARSLLESLLSRDPSKRIGCGPSDGEELMCHSFFNDTDWDKILKKEVPAPFVPTITNECDTRNFDKEFTDLPVVFTPAEGQPGIEGQLQGFTFVANNEHLA